MPETAEEVAEILEKTEYGGDALGPVIFA